MIQFTAGRLRAWYAHRMGLVELTLVLKIGQPALVPQARAWIDLEPDGGLLSEIELPLQRYGHWRWTGVIGIATPTPDCFFYRLGIVAHAGAQWSLRVRDRSLGRDMLVDTDSLTSSKCWLIGSCSLHAGKLQNAPGAPSSGGPPSSEGESNVVFLAHRRPK